MWTLISIPIVLVLLGMAIGCYFTRKNISRRPIVLVLTYLGFVATLFALVLLTPSAQDEFGYGVFLPLAITVPWFLLGTGLPSLIQNHLFASIVCGAVVNSVIIFFLGTRHGYSRHSG